MRYIGIGDLVVDIYYQNNKLLFKCGGKSFANIIFNLDYLGYNCMILGCCGNDLEGDIALKTLGNVNTTKVQRLNILTRRFYIVDGETTKIDPITGKKYWYQNNLLDTNYVLNEIEHDDILIFDSLNCKTIPIILKTSNIKIIDIGSCFDIKKYSIQQLKELFYKKFRIIQIPEKVFNFMKSYYKLDILGIYNTLSPNLLIITKGSKGTIFVYENNIVHKVLTSPAKEIDPNGCGDAHLAVMIKYFANNEVSKKLIDQAFKEATELTSKVVSKLGARGHVIDFKY